MTYSRDVDVAIVPCLFQGRSRHQLYNRRSAVIIARSRDRQSSTRADDNLFVVKFAYRAVIIIAGPSVAQTNIPSVCDDVVIFRYFGVLRDSIMLDLFVCWVFVVRFSR